MNEAITATLPLQRWEGDRGTYHLVTFTGAEAEALAAQAIMDRLEFGRRRGFGSVKVTAKIGETQWRTSVFPQKSSTEFILLISKKVMRAGALQCGDLLPVSLTL